jgi:nucleoside-diphosphate-sugar epimerase
VSSPEAPASSDTRSRRGSASALGRVIVLDNLHPQIHAAKIRPAALDTSVDFRHADITQETVWDELLAETRPRVIVHLAAETGTGQSFVNAFGTTTMLDALVRAISALLRVPHLGDDAHREFAPRGSSLYRLGLNNP